MEEFIPQLYPILKRNSEVKYNEDDVLKADLRNFEIDDQEKFQYVDLKLSNELVRVLDEVIKVLPPFGETLAKRFGFIDERYQYINYFMNLSGKRTRVDSWQELLSACLTFYITESSYINRALIKISQLKAKYYEEYRLLQTRLTFFANPSSLLITIVLKYLMQLYKYPKECLVFSDSLWKYHKVECTEFPLYRGIKDKKKILKNNLHNLIQDIQTRLKEKNPPEDFYAYIVKRLQGSQKIPKYDKYIDDAQIINLHEKYKKFDLYSKIDAPWGETILIEELHRKKHPYLTAVLSAVGLSQDAQQALNDSKLFDYADILKDLDYGIGFSKGELLLRLIARELSIEELIEKEKFIVQRFSSTSLSKEHAIDWAFEDNYEGCCLLEIALENLECIFIPAGDNQLEVLLPPRSMFKKTSESKLEDIDMVRLDYCGSLFPKVSLELFQSACNDLLLYNNFVGFGDPQNIMKKDIYREFIMSLMEK